MLVPQAKIWRGVLPRLVTTRYSAMHESGVDASISTLFDGKEVTPQKKLMFGRLFQGLKDKLVPIRKR